MRLAWSRSCDEKATKTATKGVGGNAAGALYWEQHACQLAMPAASNLAQLRSGQQASHLRHHSVAHGVVECDAVLVVLAVDQVVQPLHSWGTVAAEQAEHVQAVSSVEDWAEPTLLP